MQTIDLQGVADHARTLSGDSAARDRQLYRLVDLHASTEAVAALHAAAVRETERGGHVAAVLKAAAAVLAADVAGGDLAPADADAHDRLRDEVTSARFLASIPAWSRQLREAASVQPDTGACTVATALELWGWATSHLKAQATPAVLDELASSLCPLLAARSLALELSDGTPRTSEEVQRQSDLAHSYAARSAAATASVCAELVFGYRHHLGWDEEGCASCYNADELDALEAVMPGFASGASSGDVVEADGSHPPKEGPCAKFDGLDRFMRLRTRLDGCLTGARIARDRAAAAIAKSLTTMTTEGNA